MPVWVVTHRQAVLSAPQCLLAQGFDCESSVTFALVPSADIQPPQVAVEKRVLMLPGKCGHDEANQLVAVVDQAGPCSIRRCVRVGQRPCDRGNEVFLIRPHLQLAGSSDVFLGYRLKL